MSQHETGDDAHRAELQRDVQRLLGRCLLRVQQYERLLTSLLAHHELAGPVEGLEAQRAERIKRLEDKSLGTLVKAMFETYVVPDDYERELLPEGKTPPDQVAMAFSFRMSIAAEDRSKAKAAIEELVSLRNDLVHHLIERFDVWTEQGCVDAVCHLQESYDRIDRHFLELAGWARSMDEARELAAQFAQSSMFIDMVANGIAPDGSFDWPNSGIVRALREASSQLAKRGWTSLERARDWVEKNQPEQTPEKYGCRTWPQVLNESRLYELQYRQQADGKKAGWFRERISLNRVG